MYSVKLVDFATPSFFSATKDYYGDKDNILKVVNHEYLDREDLAAAAKEFFFGEGLGIVRVHFGEPEQFVQPITIHGERDYEIDALNFDHHNVWDCIYKIKVDHVSYKLVYIEDASGRLLRCVKASFLNLGYEDLDFGGIPLFRLSSLCGWGNIALFSEEAVLFPRGDGSTDLDYLTRDQLREGEKIVLTNLLMSRDLFFETMEEMTEDMNKPREVNWSVVFDDLLGDG